MNKCCNQMNIPRSTEIWGRIIVSSWFYDNGIDAPTTVTCKRTIDIHTAIRTPSSATNDADLMCNRFNWFMENYYTSWKGNIFKSAKSNRPSDKKIKMIQINDKTNERVIRLVKDRCDPRTLNTLRHSIISNKRHKSITIQNVIQH